jgi:hypothetical protein
VAGQASAKFNSSITMFSCNCNVRATWTWVSSGHLCELSIGQLRWCTFKFIIVELNFQGLLGGVYNSSQLESSSNDSSTMCVRFKVSQTTLLTPLISFWVNCFFMFKANKSRSTTYPPSPKPITNYTKEFAITKEPSTRHSKHATSPFKIPSSHEPTLTVQISIDP